MEFVSKDSKNPAQDYFFISCSAPVGESPLTVGGVKKILNSVVDYLPPPDGTSGVSAVLRPKEVLDPPAKSVSGDTRAKQPVHSENHSVPSDTTSGSVK